MKVSGLKAIIKEAVKEAIEELMETKQSQAQAPTLEEVNSINKTYNKTNPHLTNPLQDVFEQTRKEMTATEARNFLGESTDPVQANIMNSSINSEPDFVKNAAAIFKKSINKS